MPTYTLTLLDTVGIQDYIFGSNVLRENIGGSELVRRATRLWPFEEIRQGRKTNVRAGPLTGDPNDLDDDLCIEHDHLDAEVIYAGGGNCVALFADPDVAKDFITDLNLKLLAKAPDLDLVAIHVPVTWENDQGDALAVKLKQALDDLTLKKLDRRLSMPLLGVGTTMACRSTGLPAVGLDTGLMPPQAPPRPLSAGILAKLSVVEDTNQYLKRLLPQFKHKEANLSIPRDFDDFGEQGISYIAVVHADGNGMGQQIEKLRAAFPTATDNRRYIQTMRAFSKAIEDGSRQALQDLGDVLLRHWDPLTNEIVGRTQDEWGKWVDIGKIKLTLDVENSRAYIPFRPIVFGGDDLTFVTDGRLGLGLASAYLSLFEVAMQAQAKQLEDRYAQDKRLPRVHPYLAGLKACAGVAVVKSHYPFARAYALSEDLCRSAKRFGRREVSAFDWHFAATGLFGDLGDIRKRQYTVQPGELVMRPVTVKQQDASWRSAQLKPGQKPDAWRSWPVFERVARQFLTGEAWQGKHNKVISLRQALRDGPDAVVQFRHAYELDQLPDVGSPAMQTSGWNDEPTDKRCGYFDAVEALDFIVPLEG